MSFSELRQMVLQGGALSTTFFAETVEITQPGGSAQSVVVKIDTLYETRRGAGSHAANESRQQTLDERQRIKVCVSRNASEDNSLSERPQIGCTLVRDESVDPNRRPYVFRGEVAFEGDQHADYVFERPRRVAQGGAR